MRRGFLVVLLIPALAACERENRFLPHPRPFSQWERGAKGGVREEESSKADGHVEVADRDKALRQRALMVQTDR